MTIHLYAVVNGFYAEARLLGKDVLLPEIFPGADAEQRQGAGKSPGGGLQALVILCLC